MSGKSWRILTRRGLPGRRGHVATMASPLYNSAMPRPHATVSPLLDLLMRVHVAGTTALLPASASLAQVEAIRPAGASRRLRRQLGAPLLAAARAVLRRPRVRQLALRILKRFPGLYARAYSVMMGPGTRAADPASADMQEPSLSPRAALVLRTLRALESELQHLPGRRPRLAWVSPMPPERTGVATYAVELLAQLRDAFDIELILAQAETVLSPALIDLPQRSVAWFAEHGSEFDQVLYQIGNSPFHSHMFALLARHPGVVVLHDFFLGGALAHAQMSGAMPHAWTNALLRAHGYGAVCASTDPARNGRAHKDWPCSLGVLEGATRVIVHSQYARRLAIDWYGPASANLIDVIPHPRTAPAIVDRALARAALGVADDCFLVCSFGFIAPNKLTHELLRAWLDSALHGDARCTLVLVGANHDSPYGMEVDNLIRKAGRHASIRIAGWTDLTVYQQYLQAADVGVQLRAEAHGESSGAVLDCLNYGVPTIINANGSMAEFPADAVWRLPDRFEVHDLSASLDMLWRHPAQRAALGQQAAALIEAQFRPPQCARQYLATLDRAQTAIAEQRQAWRAALADVPAGEAGLRGLAVDLAQTLPATQRQLLIDVSDWTRTHGDADGLARHQVLELLRDEPAGLHVEPVWLDTTAGAPCYRQARNVIGHLLGLDWGSQPEPVVDARPGDIFYAPDATSAALEESIDSGLLPKWRARGITVAMLVRKHGIDNSLRITACADLLLYETPAVAQGMVTSRKHAAPASR